VIELVTPPETWGRCMDSLSLASVTPWSFPFRLESGQQGRFSFTAHGAVPWAVAKVMWHGRVQYAREALPRR